MRPLSIEERYVVKEYYGTECISGHSEFFTKAVAKGNVFHCINYARQPRRKNYLVGTKDNLTFELVVFAIIRFEDCDNRFSVAFGRQVKLANALVHCEAECGALCSHIKRIVAKKDRVLEIVELDNHPMHDFMK